MGDMADLNIQNGLEFDLFDDSDGNDDTRNVAGEPSTWDDAEYGSEDDG